MATYINGNGLCKQWLEGAVYLPEPQAQEYPERPALDIQVLAQNHTNGCVLDRAIWQEITKPSNVSRPVARQLV